MSFTVEQLEEKNMVKLVITSSDEEFEKGLEQAYNKNKSKINVQGFRKGKAPRKIIEKFYGKEVFFEDAANAIIPEAYAKAALEAVEAQLNGAFTGGKSLANMAADDTVDFSALVKENGTLKAFWEANKTNAKKGELFGAAVANIEKVTRTEVVAIVNG